MLYKIKLTNQMFQDCNQFATQSVATHIHHYAQRNQTDNNLIKQQILIGKLGEFAVEKFLLNNQIKIDSPDLTIYDHKSKTFNSDLKYQNIKIHVKSQEIEQAKKFGLSWIFQYGNNQKGHLDTEIFQQSFKKQYVAFVLIDLKVKLAKIIAFVSLNTLHQYNLFKDPKKDTLRGIKKAIYYQDIKDLSSVELWAHKQAFLDIPAANPN